MSFNSTFEKDGVIPDVVPTSVTIRHTIRVEWPDAKLSFPGQTLNRQSTQPEPKLFLEPPITEEADLNATYTLIMTDPDLTMKNDNKFGQVRHWLVTNVKVKSDGEVIVGGGEALSPWVGPAPMPLLTGQHRYVFVLCKHQGTDSSTSDADLTSQVKELSEEIAGEHQDLKDRMGFDTAALISKKGWEVKACTYMLVSGNVQSIGYNVVLGATALAHKATGV